MEKKGIKEEEEEEKKCRERIRGRIIRVIFFPLPNTRRISLQEYFHCRQKPLRETFRLFPLPPLFFPGNKSSFVRLFFLVIRLHLEKRVESFRRIV